MSNLVSSLKSEIVRLARKEAKAATDPLRKPSVAARKAIADIKRRVADLEKELGRINGVLSKVQSAQPCQPCPSEPDASDVKMRITSRNVKSLRNRLGLTASAFARLLGVTDNWVYIYENKAGALKMRTATLTAFLAAKAMTAKEARAKLGMGKK
jgi:DNA-binding XRE family transcriptional regulator